MKRQDKINIIAAIVVGIIGIAITFAVLATAPGCATNGYLETLTAWNDMVESYEYQYQLADAATQAKWKAEIDPKIIQANDALTVWGMAVGVANQEEKKAAYIALEREVIGLLLEYGVNIEQ